MDVTSLLNRSAEARTEGGQETSKQAPGLHVDPTATQWAGLPTPSPEQTPPRVSVDFRTGTKSRTPWDAGGYSLPLSLDTKFPPTNTAPVIYNGDALDVSSIPIQSAVTPSSGHSRTTSLESSPGGAISSALVSPMTSSRSFGLASLAEPTSQLEISTCQRGNDDSDDADAQLTARRPSFLDRQPLVSPGGSPKSTKHKFSDSHSSLSSYAPSTQSGCHSRISSFSTVGMVHSGNSSTIGEIPSIEEDVVGDDEIKWGTPIFGGSRPLSPAGMGQPNAGLPVRLGPLQSEGLRPRSPSDAFLISRPAHRPSLDRNYLLPQPPEQARDNPAQDRLKPLPHSMRVRQARSPIHKHKRAISAPNFFWKNHIPFNKKLGTLPEPQSQAFTKPGLIMAASSTSSGGGEQAAAETALPSLQNPSLPPVLTTETSSPQSSHPNPNSLIRCEKEESCGMETPPRKMISQFFGRNKSCTKAIPRHVWLHYCRKHYQRERYNLNTDYPKLQAELLLTQIRRIQAWSDENVAKGETSGVLRSWKLQLRKREEDRQSRNNRDSDDEDGVAPVPQWLLDSAGDSYDTNQILDMMGRLHAEISANEVRGMPEVEILPDITTEQPKGPAKRRPTKPPKAHRRAKSQGASRGSVFGFVPSSFPNLPGVAPPGGRLASRSFGAAPAPLPSGHTSLTTVSMGLPELNPTRRDSLSSSYQLATERGTTPRPEKRKAEESLEAPMTPPNVRRGTALPHRPALPKVQEEHPASLAPLRLPAHSRSRSDVSLGNIGGQRYNNRLPGFNESFNPTSEDVEATGYYPGPERQGTSALDGNPFVTNEPRHARRDSAPGHGSHEDKNSRVIMYSRNSSVGGFSFPDVRDEKPGLGSEQQRHNRCVSTSSLYTYNLPPSNNEPTRLPSIGGVGGPLGPLPIPSEQQLPQEMDIRAARRYEEIDPREESQGSNSGGDGHRDVSH